jgi:hypothetical protein
VSVSDPNLRAVIRYIPMARALKAEVDRIVTLESFEDTGDLVAGSVRRLLAGVARLVDDPYVSSLAEDVEGQPSDRRRVIAAQFALSQLLAYLEAETGVTSAGGGGVINYSKNPVSIGQLRGADPQMLAKILGQAPADDHEE